MNALTEPLYVIIVGMIALTVLYLLLRTFRVRPVQEAITEDPHEDVFAEIRSAHRRQLADDLKAPRA